MDSIEEFRSSVRSWLQDNAPRQDITSDIPAARAFQAALYDAGFVGINWPAEYGGAGLTDDHVQAFQEEARHYPLPSSPFGIGLGMCGPIIRELGTAEQQERYLRPLLRGDEIWCQLFSEPGAGSDVAGLQTMAVRDGDSWVINGQKVWTSRAHFADFGILLARTNREVPKHAGITMFIIDMQAPGVEVRPLVDMAGGSVFNEVFFDAVRIPLDSVVGTVDDGWNAAQLMLKFERLAIGGTPRSEQSPLSPENLARAAAKRLDGDRFGAEITRLAIENRALQALGELMSQESEAGIPVGPRGSVSKLVKAELDRKSADLAIRIAGGAVAGWLEEDTATAALVQAVNASPSSSIAGGTSEIQRNIISERVLELPRETAADRGVPFKDLRVGTQR